MAHHLRGKIFWVLDTFTFAGVMKTNKKITHAVAKIDQIIIEDHMIKFFVLPFDFEGEMWSYTVNLLPVEFSTKYQGTFVKEDDASHSGNISCELYSNEKGYFLYGQWIEVESVFTFWVKVDKEQQIDFD